MSVPSNLCHVCTDFFHSEDLTQLCRKERTYVGRDIHRTLEDFKEARDLKCYICSAMWDVILSKTKTAPSNPIMEMGYDLFVHGSYQECMSLRGHIKSTDEAGPIFVFFEFYDCKSSIFLRILQHIG